MAGRYGRRLMKKDEEFEEGEVWGVTMGENSSPRLKKAFKKDPSTHSLSSSTASSRPRTIPKSSSSSIEAPQSKQFSAPLDIPDWSKIYGKTNSKKNTSSSSSWVHHHDGFYANGDHHHHHCHYGDGDDVNVDDHDDDDDDDDDDEGEMLPPHEYLARKLARSQITSFSVYEGIGRTLKGRDLSKVRNAILTKTGFLESGHTYLP